MICLIHQTNYLLDQQLRTLEKAFLEEGGFTERLYQCSDTDAQSKKKAMSYTEDNLLPLSGLQHLAFC